MIHLQSHNSSLPIENSRLNIKETPGFMFTLFLSLLARNTGIFSFRMLFALQDYYEGFLETDPIHTEPPKTEIPEAGSKSPSFVEETGESDDLQLDNRQREVLEIIGRYPGHDTSYITERLPHDLSQRTVERCLSELRKHGRITYVGSKKNGGYRVVDASQESEVMVNARQEEKVSEEMSVAESLTEEKPAGPSSKE